MAIGTLLVVKCHSPWAAPYGLGAAGSASAGPPVTVTYWWTDVLETAWSRLMRWARRP
ncbi:hypothetical protein [Streptomyces sp. 8L]|uniref:hypothetical protein n=1 Tax=Streptomyces sp. 8L TaxID=2877242 RepID=UPI001CD67959|nr:hypothetical protein [Streptomyces sp. 8L]MCA1218549.1 hypothetical protein [Streptomyces sp. 8L]